jgi:hypothetical protein
VDRDVGGAEVVTVPAELPGDLTGCLQVLVSLAALVITCGGDSQDQVQGAVERQHFRLGARGDLRLQGLGGAGGDMVGLVDLAQGEEHVHHAEHAGRHG